jgi:glycine cleavage system aminomethyltransferase T
LKRLAGADLGLRDAGCYALDALRIKAGLEFAVQLDKPGFIGREALLAARGQPLRKKLVTIVLDDPVAYAWGGETVCIGGEPVGVGARAWDRWSPHSR